MLAITKASLKATFRSPQSVFFSLFFPIVLIVIFGALSGGGGISLDIAFHSGCDTSNQVYKAMASSPVFDIKKGIVEFFDTGNEAKTIGSVKRIFGDLVKETSKK